MRPHPLIIYTFIHVYSYSDLSGIGSLHGVVIDLFGSTSEEIRSAASYSLGNRILPYMVCTVTVILGCVSAGNLSKYLPFILSEIQGNPKRQYLLLHSLKEVISCYNTRTDYDSLKQHVPLIW